MTKNRSWLLTTALLGAVLLGWQCKEKTTEPQAAPEVTKAIKKNPKIILDLAEFASLEISDTTDIEPILDFKAIDSSGNLQTMDMDQAAKAFKKMMTTKKSVNLPLFEIKDSEKVVVVFQGRGYVGPIWALLLIDNKTQQIEKIQFDHSAETEGYGDAMSYSSFENQFTGRKLSRGLKNFGLRQNNSLIIEGIHEIDGLSGATETSKAAIEMINEGLNSYKVFLE